MQRWIMDRNDEPIFSPGEIVAPDDARLEAKVRQYLVPESEGARATRLAMNHVTSLEQGLEKCQISLDEATRKSESLQIQLDDLHIHYARVCAERDYYMLQAQGLKQALNNAASVLVDTVKQIEFSPFRPKDDPST